MPSSTQSQPNPMRQLSLGLTGLSDLKKKKMYIENKKNCSESVEKKYVNIIFKLKTSEQISPFSVQIL